MELGGEKTGRITFLAESLLGGGGGGVGGCGERKEKKSDEELAEGRHVSAVAEMTVLDDEHREANGGGREECTGARAEPTRQGGRKASLRLQRSPPTSVGVAAWETRADVQYSTE